jgi:hypothetical protein
MGGATMTWLPWAIGAFVVCAALGAWLFCNMARTFITKPDEKAVTLERVLNGERWDEQ